MKIFFSLTKTLVFTSLLLGLIQHYFINSFNSIKFHYSTQAIYVFILFINLFLFYFLTLIHRKHPLKTGFAYMGFGLLKMIASILFLYPILFRNNFDKVPNVIAFFLPYFIFIFIDVFYAIKLLHQK